MMPVNCCIWLDLRFCAFELNVNVVIAKFPACRDDFLKDLLLNLVGQVDEDFRSSRRRYVAGRGCSPQLRAHQQSCCSPCLYDTELVISSGFGKDCVHHMPSRIGLHNYLSSASRIGFQ